MAIIVRQLSPGPFTDYRKYKPYLRQEFMYRCAYCSLHEGDIGAGGVWHYCVDHFRPKADARFTHLICAYNNLYYAYNFCNTRKGHVWPSDEEINQGFYFVDPCKEDLYIDHTEEHDDGTLKPKTNVGKFTIRHIRLNVPFLKKMRRKRRKTQEKIVELLSLLHSLREVDNMNDDLFSSIEDKIVLLQQRYLNPPVPYEMEDQR